MDFSFDAYHRLIQTLLCYGYKIASYHNYEQFDKCVILRHDVDMDVRKALSFAEFEHAIGITASTYFFLTTSDFYNIASQKNRTALLKIADMGFEIGLHFDEKSYPEQKDIRLLIDKERDLMRTVLGLDIKSVSMHRPSTKTLRADYNLDGLVNAYSQKFFTQFKYLSDSRMRWRENIFEVIKSGQYSKLHILTHPFWYFDSNRPARDILYDFVRFAHTDRFHVLNENFTNLEDFISKEDIV